MTEKPETIDKMIAAQLRRSMELNARLKVRLQRLVADSKSRNTAGEITISEAAIAAILKDQDPV